MKIIYSLLLSSILFSSVLSYASSVHFPLQRLETINPTWSSDDSSSYGASSEEEDSEEALNPAQMAELIRIQSLEITEQEELAEASSLSRFLSAVANCLRSVFRS